MIQETIKTILAQTSPVEMNLLKGGCLETAIWLAGHLVDGLTDSQAESIAYRLIETVNS